MKRIIDTLPRMSAHYPDVPHIRWLVCGPEHILIENLSARPGADGVQFLI